MPPGGPPSGGTEVSFSPSIMMADTGDAAVGSSPNTAPTTGAIAATRRESSRLTRCDIIAPLDISVTYIRRDSMGYRAEIVSISALMNATSLTSFVIA